MRRLPQRRRGPGRRAARRPVDPLPEPVPEKTWIVEPVCQWEAFVARNSEWIQITVANSGYLELLLNHCHTLQRTGCDCTGFAVFTFDRALVERLRVYPCIRVFYVAYTRCAGSYDPQVPVAFKQANWDAVTRFKLLACWLVLDRGRHVAYFDPDVAFARDPWPAVRRAVLGSPSGLAVQRGTPYCTGVLVAAPSSECARRVFAPSAWSNACLDDETYFTRAVAGNEPPSVLPFDAFPNGMLWRDDPGRLPAAVEGAMTRPEAVCMHFNHLVGIEAKLQAMRESGMHVPTMHVIEPPPELDRSLRESCVRTLHGPYPPHQQGEHIERACADVVRRLLSERLVCSPLAYLAVPWTALAVERKDARASDRLRRWLCQELKQTTATGFWTVVQHCRGVAGACGVDLPHRTLVLRTSDPLAAAPPSARDRKHAAAYVARTTRETKCTPSAVTIPLICSSHLATAQPGTMARDLLASFCGALHTHPIREQMQAVFASQPDTVVESGSFRRAEDGQRFEELMRRSRFALCPRGVGSTSFRLCEAMEFGCVPVYISDVHSIPECFGDPDEYMIVVSATELSDLPARLRAVPEDREQRMRARCLELYATFCASTAGLARTLVERYVITNPTSGKY